MIAVGYERKGWQVGMRQGASSLVVVLYCLASFARRRRRMNSVCR
jgi:hypothetical protein